MNVPGGVYKIVLDPGGGPGSHLQLEVGQDCEFSVDSGEVEMEEGRELGESVEILPLHHPSSQEITYIQADQSPLSFDKERSMLPFSYLLEVRSLAPIV